MAASVQIEHIVENICGHGCVYVRQVIDSLQAGDVASVKELSDTADSKKVLAELCAIMAVYDESGGNCCPAPNVSAIKKAST
jgi:hypothetical protein